MVQELFIELTFIILLALVTSIIANTLKQPLIIAYILTGVLVTSFFVDFVTFNEITQIFSKIGIAFLLFLVGLNLNPKVIKEIGIVATVTGIGQIIFTSVIGFFISLYLGFSTTEALYISVALTFSSTIIIMKLLSDKDDLDSLYGKISIGFLIVQDLVAILILMFIPLLSEDLGVGILAFNVLKGIFLIILIWVLSLYILPKITKQIAKNQELLFLFSIGWCFFIASLFFYFGFSIEIGALLAGIGLSMSSYKMEIAYKVKPLRDFFIIIFFIILGSQMHLSNIPSILLPAIIFSLFILIGNPLIVMVLMGLLGFTKRNGFLAGLTVAQISEFSLILISLGVSIGHLSQEILSLVTLVGLITITGSTYMIIYADKIYPLISKHLNIFEKKGRLKDNTKIKKSYESVLFGYNRIGFNILKTFDKLKIKYVVIDFDPEVIIDLTKKGKNCIYGDADDIELFNDLNLSKLKIVISTIPKIETNSLIIKEIKRKNPDVVIMVTSHSIDDSLTLYKADADYVIMPHFLGGEYVSKMIERNGVNKKNYLKESRYQIDHLKERIREGHKHPRIEK
ncbi:cation:proton antiporter [Candidatus Woesearchaeota archaeon]|nr:cation:proton antiporter [Candidatus Woesearchaeota archaeon]